MGTWGTGIFSDDMALDVRYAWREALMDGLDDEAATAYVLQELRYVLDDEDEFVVGWTALAAAQMQTGRLQPTVRDRALAIIETGGDVARSPTPKRSSASHCCIPTTNSADGSCAR